MATIVHGPYIFGLAPDFTPSLPEGWQLIEDPEDWLLARAPSGQIYFLTRSGEAHPKREGPGGSYVDTESGVIDLNA